MHLNESSLTGLVKPLSEVDRLLIAQGFTRRGNDRFTYNIRITDSASHTFYDLRIPARRTKNSAYLRLDQPYISKQPGPERFKLPRKIPNAIIEAAKHKTAEIASYLRTL